MIRKSESEIDRAMPSTKMTTENPLSITQPIDNRDNYLIELLATSSLIAGLPTFRGERDEDIQEFMRTFEDQTLGFNDRIKVLAIRKSMIGAAREWLNENGIEETNSGNYVKLKQKILDRYSHETSYLKNRQKLGRMKFELSSRETLESFIDRFLALAKRIQLTNDKEIITSIVLALPAETQSDLEYLEAFSNIRSLDDLKRLARRYDSIVAKKVETPQDIQKLGAIVSSVSQEELRKAIKDIRDEFQRQHEETLAAIKSQGNNQRSNINGRKCYNCQQVGHLIRDCPKPRQPKRIEFNTETNGSSKIDIDEKKDYEKINQEARLEYEKNYGKPKKDCSICQGYHFVYHCPLKTLKE